MGIAFQNGKHRELEAGAAHALILETLPEEHTVDLIASLLVEQTSKELREGGS